MSNSVKILPFFPLRGEETAIQGASAGLSQMPSLLLERGLVKTLLSCPCREGDGAEGTIPYYNKEIEGNSKLVSATPSCGAHTTLNCGLS